MRRAAGPMRGSSQAWNVSGEAPPRLCGGGVEDDQALEVALTIPLHCCQLEPLLTPVNEWPSGTTSFTPNQTELFDKLSVSSMSGSRHRSGRCRNDPNGAETAACPMV